VLFGRLSWTMVSDSLTIHCLVLELVGRWVRKLAGSRKYAYKAKVGCVLVQV
jgi:hypothetical protein